MDTKISEEDKWEIQRGADSAIEFQRIKKDKKLWPKVKAELKKRAEAAKTASGESA